jgi:hypothetical protein
MFDNKNPSKTIVIIRLLLLLLLMISVASISAVTLLWLSSVYEEQGMTLFSNKVFITSGISFLASVLITLIGESLIEDIIKVIFVCGFLFALHKHPIGDLLIIGLIAGFISGFIFNRFND